MSQTNARILVIDDDSPIARAIERALKREPWTVVIAKSGEEALELMRRDPCAVVCTDALLPGMSGLDLLMKIRECWPDSKRVLLSGFADVPMLSRAVNDCGIFRFLTKPFDDATLRETIASAFECHVDANEPDNPECKSGVVQLSHLAEALEAKIEERTRQLTKAKREWELTFDTVPNPAAIIDENYLIRRGNLAAALLGGVEVRTLPGSKCHHTFFRRDTPCQGCPIADLGSQSTAAGIIAGHGNQKLAVQATPFLDASGSFVCTYEDITQRELDFLSSVHREKMVALGQLAGGIAHEINNPLAGVLAFAQCMQDEPGRSESDLESLQMIEKAVLRCKRIIDSMLKFSRGAKPVRQNIDITECVRDTLLLFEVALKTNSRVHLESRVPATLPAILGDAQQLEQVLMNLLQNGVQAMPAREGTLTVEAGGANGEVFLSISDTGTGIRPEHRPHIFEAAFTTKPAGEGTGFGLAIVQSIVASHGGKISVDTELNRGTTFRLTFPCVKSPKGEPNDTCAA